MTVSSARHPGRARLGGCCSTLSRASRELAAVPIFGIYTALWAAPAGLDDGGREVRVGVQHEGTLLLQYSLWPCWLDYLWSELTRAAGRCPATVCKFSNPSVASKVFTGTRPEIGIQQAVRFILCPRSRTGGGARFLACIKFHVGGGRHLGSPELRADTPR